LEKVWRSFWILCNKKRIRRIKGIRRIRGILHKHMSIKSFRELLVWQKSHELVLKIYQITGQFPSHERFSLIDQMRRASISVPSNIAEGFKRRGNKDKLHFYNMAEGSLEELKYQLFLSKDLQYIAEQEYQAISHLSEIVSSLLAKFIQAHRN
jgi:four helix bundle protein